MIKIGYKVLRERELGFLMSFSQSLPYHDGARTYHINKKTVPLNGFGPLTIFTNLIAALRYNYSMGGNGVIFVCQYEESEHDYVWDTHHRISKNEMVYDYLRHCSVSIVDVALAKWVKITTEV